MGRQSAPKVIGVLMGGTSGEREISLRSGEAVARGLAHAGYRSVTVDIKSETGEELDQVKIDAAFIALHGPFGEDGKIQRMLEDRGIPYTGSNPTASRAAMDKVESKRLFKLRGLSTPTHRVIARGDSEALLEACARAIGYPVVLKPRSQGSSLGVTVHHDRGTLHEGAAECFTYGTIGLMEKFIQGRELTVGFLQGKPLPFVELRPSRGFFDYTAKYEDDETEYVVEPDLSDLDRRRVLRTAREAVEALGCEGFCRVDLILTPLCSVYVLEVNTIPGMTERSLFPKAAAAQGIEFPELCAKITEQAFNRQGRAFWAAAML